MEYERERCREDLAMKGGEELEAHRSIATRRPLPPPSLESKVAGVQDYKRDQFENS